MESISNLYYFGEIIKAERKKRGMNQEEFYNFLFPENKKTTENIKKKMSNIENAKEKTIDFEFIFALCNKCDLSYDFLFGKLKNYENYDKKFVCEYTGLNENVIAQLHEWSKAKDFDVNNNLLRDGCCQVFNNDSDAKDLMSKSLKKQEAIQFLKIINYLFEQGESGRGKNKEPYSNLSILYSIYSMCMTEAEELLGEIDLSNQNFDSLDNFQNNINIIKPSTNGSIMIKDSTGIWHTINSNDLIKQIAKNNLNMQLDRLIQHIKK